MKGSIFKRTWPLAFAVVISLFSTLGYASCSNSTLNGTYGFSFDGFEGISSRTPLPISQFVPLAAAGTFEFDGSGGVTDNHTASYGGLLKNVSQNGTYQINGDCTGTATFNLCPLGCPSVTTWDLIVVNGGQEIRFLVTGDSRVMEGSMTKE